MCCETDRVRRVDRLEKKSNAKGDAWCERDKIFLLSEV